MVWSPEQYPPLWLGLRDHYLSTPSRGTWGKRKKEGCYKKKWSLRTTRPKEQNKPGQRKPFASCTKISSSQALLTFDITLFMRVGRGWIWKRLVWEYESWPGPTQLLTSSWPTIRFCVYFISVIYPMSSTYCELIITLSYTAGTT